MRNSFFGAIVWIMSKLYNNDSGNLNKLSGYGYIFEIGQLAYRYLLCKTSDSTIAEYEKYWREWWN